MEHKQIPLGVYSFEELITENYYFFDKSLLIKDIVDSGAKVTLLPRPRRFGKTINMSMLQVFFEKTEISKRSLFDGLKITGHPTCMAEQGQYPVIFITFKDIKDPNWAACEKSIRDIISAEFQRHGYLLESSILGKTQKIEFEHVINKTGDTILYRKALATLSAHLANYHKRSAIILLDEYDTPINAAFDHGYYKDLINFMRIFMSSGLKDNPNLDFGILTGILRVAKESIFSGLNNLEVNSLLSKAYSDRFGLLEDEVIEVLAYYGLSDKLDAVRAWYDGYQSGPHKIYNPWSIINFVKKHEFDTYWINTSENALLKKVLQYSAGSIKEDLERLIAGKTVTKELDENVVMEEILTSERASWSLLLMSGYLTFNNYRQNVRENLPKIADLSIPNTEVATIYNTQVLSWFEINGTPNQYNSMLQSLVDGNTEDFHERFDNFVTQTFSVFDVTGKYPERFYHGFALGMLASLQDTHEIVSNRESGFGRYDISIFPKDLSKPGIIIEFKVASKLKKETLQAAAKAALKQINDRQYEAAMRARGITKIIKIGIAFVGKKNLVVFG